MNAHNRVMLVDDEEAVRVSWNRYLSGRGFNVAVVDDGGRAISELAAEPADVVVSDLKMPGVDGLQLLEWIHERQPSTRFILLTGYGNEQVERRARELGAFEYLNKPIGPDTLAAVVTAALHLPLDLEVPVETGEAVIVEQPTEALSAELAVTDHEAREGHSGGRLPRALGFAGGLIAAPLMGLAFVIFLPVIGFVTLFWFLGAAVLDIFRKVEGTRA